MNALTIADTQIRTDAHGRYWLNDLHRAAGGEKRHQPSDWLRLQSTQELIATLANEKPGIPGIESIQRLGTFVCKELVYAYAMWISPAFHLKVIRAYDALVTSQVPVNPATLSRLQLIELAMQAEQERLALEHKVEALAPKAEALDRIATHSAGSFCIRDAAKTLQIQEKRLRQFMFERHWIYRRPMNAGWLAYSDKLQAGLMEHKMIRGEKSDGSEWTDTQARVTAKGMAKLAVLLSTLEEHT